MKKFILFLLSLIICFAAIGCSSSENTTNNGEESKTNSNYTNVWESLGNGAGTKLPEPNKEYDINEWDTFFIITVENVDEAFFDNYVLQCKNMGLNGNVGTATLPDKYFTSQIDEIYRAEVRFYEADQKVTISLNWN